MVSDRHTDVSRHQFTAKAPNSQTTRQNNVSELHSLFKFLRVKPYNDLARFNLDIGKPITSGRGAGRAMKRLQVILKSIMLRRRKEDTLNGKALIDLPARNLEVVSCPFDASEAGFYKSLETKMESTLDKLMSDKSKSAGSNYMSVLLLLLRLRQGTVSPPIPSMPRPDERNIQHATIRSSCPRTLRRTPKPLNRPLRRVKAGTRKTTALSRLSASSPSSGSARCAPLCKHPPLSASVSSAV